jgi:hypothetical protein
VSTVEALAPAPIPRTVRTAGFRVCPPDALECPHCGFVWHRRTFTAGHSVELCGSNKRQRNGSHVHCNAHLFFLRIQTDNGPRVLALVLENARARELLLSILEPAVNE